MTRTKVGALLLALTTIMWLGAATPALADHRPGHGDAAGGGQMDDDKGGSAAGKNGDPDPEPTEDTETASKGKADCTNAEAGKQGGDYESTCDGTVGRQGGDGNGKCAGCDGRADNKNPKGQYKNDRNNGYECDNNGGVAKGNPAHSRCKKPPVVQETCPDGRPMPPNGVCKEPIDKPGLPEEPERVLGLRFQGVPPVPARVQPSRQRPAVLPFTGTGAALSGFALLGLGLIAAGGLIIRPRRKDELGS